MPGQAGEALHVPGQRHQRCNFSAATHQHVDLLQNCEHKEQCEDAGTAGVPVGNQRSGDNLLVCKTSSYRRDFEQTAPSSPLLRLDSKLSLQNNIAVLTCRVELSWVVASESFIQKRRRCAETHVQIAVATGAWR